MLVLHLLLLLLLCRLDIWKDFILIIHGCPASLVCACWSVCLGSYCHHCPCSAPIHRMFSILSLLVTGLVSISTVVVVMSMLPALVTAMTRLVENARKNVSVDIGKHDAGCRDAVGEGAVMIVIMSLTGVVVVVVVVAAAAVVDQCMFVMMAGNDDESDDEDDDDDDDDDDDGRGGVKLQGTRLRHFQKPWSITTPLSITIVIGIDIMAPRIKLVAQTFVPAPRPDVQISILRGSTNHEEALKAQPCRKKSWQEVARSTTCKSSRDLRRGCVGCKDAMEWSSR